jgi:Leu/Phe-tRNA-protein transferase
MRACATNLIKTIYRSPEATEITQKMNSADYGEVQLDEDTYKLAEKCAKELNMTVDEFVRKAIDEKYEKLKRTK